MKFIYFIRVAHCFLACEDINSYALLKLGGKSRGIMVIVKCMAFIRFNQNKWDKKVSCNYLC